MDTVTYYLVLLRPGPHRADIDASLEAHVTHIDSMTARGVVLLGGDFAAPIGGAEAAYLLHTPTADDAAGWAARDPHVVAGVFEAEVVPWALVGIGLDAIDPMFDQ